MAVNRILYFYLLLLTFVFFVLFDLYLFHLLLVFFLLLPLLSLLAVLPMRGAVRLAMDSSDEIVPKGRCRLRLTVENAAPLPCPCVRVHLSYHNLLGRTETRYAETARETVQLVLGAHRAVTLKPALQTALCGRVDFTVRRVEVCDLLGLFCVPIPKGNVRGGAASVYVLPAPQSRQVEIEDAADIGLDSASYSPDKPGGDPSEVFQLRDYREGDPLRSVHWKLSGRMQRLIVREAGLPLNPSLRFLLELREGATPEQAERLLGTAFAFSEYLLAREIVHDISWVDGDGVLASVSVTSADMLGTALHSLLALPGQARWSALVRFAGQAAAREQAHLVYLIAGAEWDAAADAEAERTLGGLMELGFCRRMTLMPDACPPEMAEALRALGLEVQLLDGRMPDRAPEAAP